MNIKYILLCAALVCPLSSQAEGEWDAKSATNVLKKHNSSVKVNQKKHDANDAAVTALELAFGLTTKAYIPGKPKQRQRLITQKAVRQGYVKSTRSGGLIDKKMVFSSGSAQLNTYTKNRLKILATMYHRHKSEIKHINVAGHTNSVGSKQENTILSNKRAVSVKQELISLGVPKWVINAKGFGEYHLLPRISTSSPLNRRVEYSISKR